jgi:hypothetical protein
MTNEWKVTMLSTLSGLEGPARFTAWRYSCYKTKGNKLFSEEGAMEDKEIREENRRIRFLRFLVDLSVVSIQQSDLSLEEALKIVEEVKQAACNLFPGKEETFNLIYRPRFMRTINEKFVLIGDQQSPGNDYS